VDSWFRACSCYAGAIKSADRLVSNPSGSYCLIKKGLRSQDSMDHWVRLINLGRRWRGPWALTKCVEAVAVLVFLAIGFSAFVAIRRRGRTLGQIKFGDSTHCDFPAIFNFGDSNSDTGGKSAAFDRLLSPNGDTFFGKPSGRYCDGQVLVDFIGDYSHFPI
jgi:hypothetical protein